MSTRPAPEPEHVSALREAVAICGSQAELARRVSTFLDRPTFRQPSVSYWLSNHVLLEAAWWPAIEHATSGRVTRQHLRPDVFPRNEVA